MNTLLDLAIQDTKAGRKQAAYKKLHTIMQQNPSKEDAEIAWLCLAQLITEPARKRSCLEKVIRLNPNNRIALNELKRLNNPDQINTNPLAKIPPPTSNLQKSALTLSPDVNQEMKTPLSSRNHRAAEPTAVQITKTKAVGTKNETAQPEVNESKAGGLSIEGVILLPVFGAYAGATLGAGEIILYAIDILINSGSDWLLNIFLIGIGATIGAPIVILVGIILAIIGGIGGFIGSIAIALACLIIYGLLSLTELTKELRGVAVFIVTVAGFVALTEYGLNQQIINSLVPLDISKLPLMNNILGAIVGVVVGASLFSVGDVETEESPKAVAVNNGEKESFDALGGIWRGYRKLGKGLLDMHEDYLEDKSKEDERRKWRNW